MGLVSSIFYVDKSGILGPFESLHSEAVGILAAFSESTNLT